MDYPEMIVEWYKTAGYDFVALSEHNALAEGTSGTYAFQGDELYVRAKIVSTKVPMILLHNRRALGHARCHLE